MTFDEFFEDYIMRDDDLLKQFQNVLRLAARIAWDEAMVEAANLVGQHDTGLALKILELSSKDD